MHIIHSQNYPSYVRTYAIWLYVKYLNYYLCTIYCVVLVFITGVTVVGPHSVITSAVSADLVSTYVRTLYICTYIRIYVYIIVYNMRRYKFTSNSALEYSHML